MKKVLFILNDLEGGGAERVFVNIANGFVKDNIIVHILLGKKKGSYLSIVDANISISEVGSTNFFGYLKAFINILREDKQKYTHIFTASHYISSAIVFAKKYTRSPVKIYQTHHYSHPAKRELKYLKGDLLLKLLYYTTAPSADKLIAVSEGSLQWLRNFSHRKLPQSMVIYNPVYDDSLFTMAAGQPVYPVDVSGKTILVNAGRLSEQKDQLTLIKAFIIYKQQYQHTVLFILGTGPLQDSLQSFIDANELQQHVFLVGFQDNPYSWIARCNVFVLSSKYEGFGNVIVEAMALGKTVVSTNCPSGPAEILENGKLGYLCPVQDAAAMAMAIEKAVNTPMSEQLVIQASLQYRSNVIVKKYKGIL